MTYDFYKIECRNDKTVGFSYSFFIIAEKTVQKLQNCDVLIFDVYDIK